MSLSKWRHNSFHFKTIQWNFIIFPGILGVSLGMSSAAEYLCQHIPKIFCLRGQLHLDMASKKNSFLSLDFYLLKVIKQVTYLLECWYSTERVVRTTQIITKGLIVSNKCYRVMLNIFCEIQDPIYCDIIEDQRNFNIHFF